MPNVRFARGVKVTPTKLKLPQITVAIQTVTNQQISLIVSRCPDSYLEYVDDG